MKKETLRKLRRLNATQAMVKDSASGSLKCYVRAQCLNGFIKFALFFQEDLKHGIVTPMYEIFVNPDGREWITRELDEKGKEEKWSKATLYNLPRTPGYWYEGRYWITADTKLTLKRLMPDSKKKEMHILQDWQNKINKDKIEEREKREQAHWDEDMKLVPKTPNGLKEWMHRECNESFFLIYEYRKNQKKAYCSRCRKEVAVSHPIHNKDTRCPSCGAVAKFKAAGRLQTLGTGTYFGAVIQKIKKGIVIRRYYAHEWYRDRLFKSPSVILEETTRTIILEDGTVKRYEFGFYKNKMHRWILNKDWKGEYYPIGIGTKTYPKTLAQAKKSPVLLQSSMFAWDVLPLPPENYLAVEKGNPAVEKLAKIGMFKLARDLIRMKYVRTLLDEGQTELAKMLKIDGSRLKRIREMDGGAADLKWYQREKAQDTVWDDWMIRDMGSEDIGPEEFRFLPHKVLSEVQAYNYLRKQADQTDESLRQTLITWNDYLNMAEMLKMDERNLQVLKPKSLKAAHARLIEIRQQSGMKKQAEAIDKKWPKVMKSLPKLKKFEYVKGDYCIVAPKETLDIVREGTILGHCVHTCEYYFDRISRDESYLFFLRRANNPDTPWYTLEVEPSGNIRQKRTTGDNQNEDFQKTIGFLKKWQKHFQKQLTAKEKELGEKADSARKKNYADLRKNGNRVWHGKLAGQLLADVLESDFMAIGE